MISDIVGIFGLLDSRGSQRGSIFALDRFGAYLPKIGGVFSCILFLFTAENVPMVNAYV